MPLRGDRQIRGGLARDQQLGEAVRDVQGGFDAGIRWTVRADMELQYTEPMTLGSLETAPLWLFARVIDLSDPETPVKTSGVCHFIAQGAQSVKITSVDGMSFALNGGRNYRFTFLIGYRS